jgi:hypothetical protein
MVKQAASGVLDTREASFRFHVERLKFHVFPT